MGANAVLAMRYDANEIAAAVTEVLAYGTAVVVEEAALIPALATIRPRASDKAGKLQLSMPPPREAGSALPREIGV